MQLRAVAPFTGAWIEIVVGVIAIGIVTVAPFTGAWIEISWFAPVLFTLSRRSLHGSVD